MEKLLQDGVPFQLLVGEDEAYDKQARSLVQRLQRGLPKDFTTVDFLEVGRLLSIIDIWLTRLRKSRLLKTP